MSLDGNQIPNTNKSIRRLLVAFGDIFNNIWLVRYNSDGSIQQKSKVPINYALKDEWVSRIEDQASFREGNIEIENYLPRMSFELSSMMYDVNRQRSPTTYLQGNVNTDGTAVQQRAPVPYIFGMTLSIYCKNTEDSLMLLEQILPVFSPQLNVRIKEIDNINLHHDILITLDQVTKEDNALSGFTQNRVIRWDLRMSMHGNIYPEQQQTPLILDVIVDVEPAFEEIAVHAIGRNPPDYNIDNSTTTIGPIP